MSNPADLLAERYGRSPESAKRQRRLVIITAVGLLVAFFTWAIWAQFASTPKLEYKTSAFKIISPQEATVDFDVIAIERPIICVVQVLDNNFEVVGFKEVEVAAKAQGAIPAWQTVSTRLNTTELGVSGLVHDCRVK